MYIYYTRRVTSVQCKIWASVLPLFAFISLESLKIQTSNLPSVTVTEYAVLNFQKANAGAFSTAIKVTASQ